MLKFGARIVAPVNVGKLLLQNRPTICIPCIWIAVPRFAVACCFWPWAFVGGGSKPRAPTALPAPVSTTPVRRSRPTFTTARMSPW